MDHLTVSNALLDFIQRSPSCYHVIATIRQMLEQHGYRELLEGEPWDLTLGGAYYVIRNGSSLITFRVPKQEFQGFMITASHSDSPTFQIKEHAELAVEHHSIQLNTERYGGMLCSTWLDRPLSVAGRVIVKNGALLETRLVNIDRDLLVIPNVAIHMNRNANDGYHWNTNVDLFPLFGDGTAKGKFRQIVAETAGATEDNLLATDLFLYCRTPGTVWGADNTFLSSPRLDDLQCVFASIRAFLEAKASDSVPVCCVFDNEEVGSGTKQGAASTFLPDTLQRLNAALGRTEAEYNIAVANSFLVSADNAHAVHPNHPEYADKTHRPVLNGGIVIKFNANRRYTTDALSCSIFSQICKEANVPVQYFTNRSDLAGGSTLGSIANTQVSLNSIDIGLPQLAMHSAYETAGVQDTGWLIRALTVFFEKSLHAQSNGSYLLLSH
ncbi:MAG: M18 family aminopeptidase [Oscillospiraceae bacterium]|jgi:aspartyl aminopeptidase